MKKVVKKIASLITFILVLPCGMAARLCNKIGSSYILYDLFAEIFSLAPGRIGVMIRACYYKQTLKKSYLDLDIEFGSIISKMDAGIGHNVLINGHSTVGLVEIGDRAVIADYVSVLSGRHQHNFENLDREILDNADKFTVVNIGHDSFIGEHCTVMANVGYATIVGAGSVVVKDIPACTVAAGNPAKVVRSRSSKKTDELSEISP